MSKDNQTDLRNKFVPRLLPWLLGALMLVVYWFTLNRWVTLLNLDQVAKASGWVWQPQLYSPLVYLATLPFHWLPAAKIPLALNLLSSVCAALVVVLLARSVALLPHDRTEAQRQREKSDFSFLTGWPAVFPPIIAVLFTGLQLAFWENATSFTGEMIDLLLFAFIIWLLLEFRLDESPWRLTAAFVAYGVGIAESWAFVGYFPIFLVFIIWLKRLEFFNIRFLFRAFLCGLAGMSLVLLLPLLANMSRNFEISFWEALRPNLRLDWQAILALQVGELRHKLIEASLSTFLPLLLLALRWSATFGDNSRMGSALANNMLHLVYAVIFTVCIWTTFDPPFSAGQLLGGSSLTLCYLTALGIGYYCGYFLLVFGKRPIPTRRNSRPEPLLPPGLMWICPVIVAGTFVAAAVCLGTLLYRNVPIIHEVNGDTIKKFAEVTAQNLPKGGAIVLGDSDISGQDQPLRTLIIQAVLAREGRSRDFPVVDTQSANWAPYHRFLHTKYPDKWPLIVNATNRGGVSPLIIYDLMVSLSRSNSICYLNPSYGYYFEHFYQEPHGLIYGMKELSNETLLPPPPDKNLIAENEAFWARTTDILRPAVLKSLDKSDSYIPVNLPTWILMHLHSPPVVDENAALVGMLLSRGLNDWGVQLQRAGELGKAAACFSSAQEFNPDNVVADINLAFNQTLRAGAPMEIDLSRVNLDQFGKYRSWNAVINANGPFDEISFCFENGMQLMQNRYFRQAAEQFNRVRQLAPDNLDARLELAQIYLFNRLPDRAEEVLQDPLARPDRFNLNATNSTSVNILAAAVHFQKNEPSAGSKLMELEISRHPTDDTLLTAAAQAYFMRGLYTNALRLIDSKLARSPDDVQWLFGKGYASIQTGAYDNAIGAMSHILEIQTNNPTAKFNRALAYLDAGKLDLARTDYRALQTTYTNSYQIAYGLGDIAARQHDTNEAIRNFQIYLTLAPTNSPEHTNVLTRLTHLRGN